MELEVVEKIVKDINENGKEAESLKNIDSQYEYLKGVFTNENMKFNTDINKVLNIGKALQKKEGYCPCMVAKNEDTLCACKWMREEDKCICGLYIKK